MREGKLMAIQWCKICWQNKLRKICLALAKRVLWQEVEKAAKELQYDFSGVDATKNDKGFLWDCGYADFVVLS